MPDLFAATKNSFKAKLQSAVERLAAAYDKWWDDLYPTMIKLGGDKGEPELAEEARPFCERIAPSP